MDKENKNGYEDICYICHRTESKVGKIIKLPNNISVCADCMQTTFNQINTNGMGFMMDMPNMDKIKDDYKKKQTIKKKKDEPKEDRKPIIETLPAPHVIKAQFDEHVVGQERAKKILSVAVYNHYKRVMSQEMEDVDETVIEKSNILMLGPTGCGKTHIGSNSFGFSANTLRIAPVIAIRQSVSTFTFLTPDLIPRTISSTGTP